MNSPQLRCDVCVREIDGEAIILDRTNEQMHSFNATAACILEAIDGKRTEEEISEILSRRFTVEKDVAQHDTRQVIEQLRELGLLKLEAEAEAS